MSFERALTGHWAAPFAALALLSFSGCATSRNTAGATATGPARFDLADANHDGKLSRDEASDFLVNQMFDSRDASGDGRMTQQEWTGGDSARVGQFKKRDLDGDDVVTKQEAISYGRRHGIANEIMKEADKNHDGSLDRGEARAYAGSREGPPD